METVTSNNKCQETLQYSQVLKLNKFYQMPVPVKGKGHFPTLQVTMQGLVQKVYSKLEEKGVTINDVRINGGCAGYIVGDSNNQHYNDIDLIFSVDIESLERMICLKDYVMDCLLGYLPESTNLDKLSPAVLAEAYVHKFVKVWQEKGDRWTLVTLYNDSGMNLELKFVCSMKRKYQFSVDSFQIILDSLMQFYELSSAEMSEDFYPTVVVESVWGNYEEAVYHLNNRLIHTCTPQEIRGGGLLKYCDLLARGYSPACGLSETETLERLMCSRFFIDYSDSTSQHQQLDSYLMNHFGGDLELMMCYLQKLYTVVDTSTVCLMGHERREALELITSVNYAIQWELETLRHMQMDKQSAIYQDYLHQSYYPIQQAVAVCSGYPCIQHVY